MAEVGEVIARDGVLFVKQPCQNCGIIQEFTYEPPTGYICHKCNKTLMVGIPYWYIRCIKCGRIFYANNHNAVKCIDCLPWKRRPKRRKACIRVNKLIEGEMFYSLDHPHTSFIIINGVPIFHDGVEVSAEDLEALRSAYNIYKI